MLWLTSTTVRLPWLRSPSFPYTSFEMLCPYGQHLVYQQDLRLQVRRHGKRQPHVHSARICSPGVSINFSISANATISSNLRSISRLLIPKLTRSGTYSPTEKFRMEPVPTPASFALYPESRHPPSAALIRDNIFSSVVLPPRFARSAQHFASPPPATILQRPKQFGSFPRKAAMVTH